MNQSIESLDVVDLNVEIVDTYMNLLALWQERLRRLRDLSDNTNAASLDAIDIYLAIGTEMETLKREVQGAARTVLQEIMVETGETTISTPIGKAFVTAPYSTVVYDRNAIDLLCNHDEDLKIRLEPFRIQRPVSGSLRVERK